MTTLKGRLATRNLGLSALYWFIRPTSWIVAWCLVDFAKILHFHLLINAKGRAIMHLGLIETVKSFFRFSLWPLAIPLALLAAIDFFVVASWFKRNVIQIKAKDI